MWKSLSCIFSILLYLFLMYFHIHFLSYFLLLCHFAFWRFPECIFCIYKWLFQRLCCLLASWICLFLMCLSALSLYYFFPFSLPSFVIFIISSNLWGYLLKKLSFSLLYIILRWRFYNLLFFSSLIFFSFELFKKDIFSSERHPGLI